VWQRAAPQRELGELERGDSLGSSAVERLSEMAIFLRAMVYMAGLRRCGGFWGEKISEEIHPSMPKAPPTARQLGAGESGSSQPSGQSFTTAYDSPVADTRMEGVLPDIVGSHDRRDKEKRWELAVPLSIDAGTSRHTSHGLRGAWPLLE